MCAQGNKKLRTYTQLVKKGLLSSKYQICARGFTQLYTKIN